ncbi:MAG TPA: hypothetical protein QF901_10365, partial [Gammaproteobacteria bacterium]|nr:hypothetical protein [Gammaproteobacteria bacterium]
AASGMNNEIKQHAMRFIDDLIGPLLPFPKSFAVRAIRPDYNSLHRTDTVVRGIKPVNQSL